MYVYSRLAVLACKQSMQKKMIDYRLDLKIPIHLSWKINDFFYIKYDSSDSAVWTQSLIKDWICDSLYTYTYVIRRDSHIAEEKYWKIECKIHD